MGVVIPFPLERRFDRMSREQQHAERHRRLVEYDPPSAMGVDLYDVQIVGGMTFRITASSGFDQLRFTRA